MIKLFHHPIIKAMRIFQFIIALAIFFYAALAPMGTSSPDTINPVVLHFVGNLLLVLSAWLALSDKLQIKYLFIVCLILSGLAECAQSLTPSRVTDAMDLLTNAAGLSLGLTIAYFAHLYFYKNTASHLK